MNHTVSPKNRTNSLVSTALCAAMLAVCGWLCLPTAVPVTMQTFGVFLTLELLGARRGAAAIGVYLLLGGLGLPVFAGFTAGIGVLLGPNGGYMLGWFLCALATGLGKRLFGSGSWVRLFSMLAGLALCYAAGTAWFMAVYAHSTGSIGWWTALTWCVFPFVIPDILKLLLAFRVSRRLKTIPNFQSFIG